MSMARLMFVGQAVVDHCFEVGAFSAMGGKQVATAQRSDIGGIATNAARAALRLRGTDGPQIALCAALGDDDAGQWLLGWLREEGLELSALRQVAGCRTGVSAVLVDARGERQVHNFRGDAHEAAAVPEARDLQGSAGVLVDPRWPQAAAAALRWANEQRVVSLLDAEVAAPEVLRVLAPQAVWVAFSIAGLMAWAAETGPVPTARGAGDDAGQATRRLHVLLQRVAAQCPGREVIVTRGARGLSWCRPDGRLLTYPAFDVRAVDTNGAGDVFHGALLLALVQGRAPEDAVRWAMAAAALACSRAGAASATPSAAEVDAFLERQR
jgi:sulfofructose kinase